VVPGAFERRVGWGWGGGGARGRVAYGAGILDGGNRRRRVLRLLFRRASGYLSMGRLLLGEGREDAKCQSDMRTQEGADEAF